MEREDEGKVHQLLGLGVQGAGGMNLLEVVRVALARVEVTAPEFRHFSPHQNGAGNELEGETSRDTATGTRSQLEPARDLGDSKAPMWPVGQPMAGSLEDMRPIYGWLLRDRGGLQPDRPRPR
jgi:hypothetical protein